jgi:non-lysosomal glucosylceramidase
LTMGGAALVSPALGGMRLKENQKAPVRSDLADLLKPGQPDVYSGADLQYIGMPVGGFFAGTVYLGGDGQLWNWDIFNQEFAGCIERPNTLYMGTSLDAASGVNYVDPVRQKSTFQQAFRLLDLEAEPREVYFGNISFRGEYPVGKVDYKDGNAEVEMSLVAFSPFCPLDAEVSSFPATTMTFRVKNTGQAPSRYRVLYECENPVLVHSRGTRADFALTHDTEGDSMNFGARSEKLPAARPPILFEDWSSGAYDGWTTTGDAFGDSPRKVVDLPSYMGPVDAETTYVANSHQNRNGENVEQADAHTGTLTSPSFRIERRYINLRMGGGNHPGRTCINLVVGSRVVRSVTGHDRNRMQWESMLVEEFQGQQAQLVVVDQESGGWGNISLSKVVFSDEPLVAEPLESAKDYGSFCVKVVGGCDENTGTQAKGQIGKDLALDPGQEAEVTFVIAWYFPNCAGNLPGRLNWYATRWTSAKQVADEIGDRWTELKEKTLRWNQAWYDSTLPSWFLDRTFLNTSILATKTCHRLDEGRYYFWEGTGLGPGTCTHVWGYGQSIGRLFPEIERYLRKEIDFGTFYHKDTGAIDYRGEYGEMVFVDGQASCILRAYREQQMSQSHDFLTALWPNIKGAMQNLMRQDPKGRGILSGAQYNTLDTAWYGDIAWTSSLYIAALRACEAMAREMSDSEFESECRGLAEKGRDALAGELFNGEYFFNIADPDHPEANNTRTGCHIDQIYGQSWALQVGLPRVAPQKESVQALRSLYKHNFYSDIWEYRRKMHEIPGGRWYATPKESGLIMCSFPRGGVKESAGKGGDAWAVGYFNECMTGFEHQVAAHMIAEGLVEEGLQVLYAIHQRYHGSKRNPYNEVEYGDHYGRATASFGSFVALTGFQVDGPNKKMSFSPKVKAGRHKWAFVNESGWGVYEKAGESVKTTYLYRDGRLV